MRSCSPLASFQWPYLKKLEIGVVPGCPWSSFHRWGVWKEMPKRHNSGMCNCCWRWSSGPPGAFWLANGLGRGQNMLIRVQCWDTKSNDAKLVKQVAGPCSHTDWWLTGAIARWCNCSKSTQLITSLQCDYWNYTLNGFQIALCFGQMLD